MKLFYAASVVSDTGILAASNVLQNMHDIDLAIAGADNLSFYSRGIHRNDAARMKAAGFNVLCAGNYSFSHPAAREVFEESDWLIRPYNLFDGAAGKGMYISGRTLVICLLGTENVLNIFGKTEFPYVKSPFLAFDELYAAYQQYDIVVDFHGSSPIEKRAFAEYVKNRAVAVIGSHTNVQTADEQIIEKCGYITDAGMCGVAVSIGGLDPKVYVERYLSILPEPLPHTEGPATVQGVVLTIQNGACTEIERVNR